MEADSISQPIELALLERYLIETYGRIKQMPAARQADPGFDFAPPHVHEAPTASPSIPDHSAPVINRPLTVDSVVPAPQADEEMVKSTPEVQKRTTIEDERENKAIGAVSANIQEELPVIPKEEAPALVRSDRPKDLSRLGSSNFDTGGFQPTPGPAIQGHTNSQELTEREWPGSAGSLLDKLAVNAGQGSLNDKLASGKMPRDLSEKLKHTPIAELKSAISINQRIVFVTDLFGSDNDAYKKSISALDNFRNKAEAMQFLQDELAARYNWAQKPDTAAEFTELVRRRFA